MQFSFFLEILKEKSLLKAAKPRSQLDPCIFNKSAVSYCSLRITTIRKCAKGTKGSMNIPQGPELKQSQ